MDGGAWWATVHGVAKSWTRLSDFTFTFHSLFYKFKLQKIPKVTHNKKNANSYYEILILSYQFSSVQSLSRVQLFGTPWSVAYQAPLSMSFSRQEYWSGLLFPSPGDLPDPGIKRWSPALQVFFFVFFSSLHNLIVFRCLFTMCKVPSMLFVCGHLSSA